MLATAQRTTQDSELDTGPKLSGAGDERFCVVARAAKPASEMLRFVVAPDGNVVADIKRNLPGRGLWVTATRRALEEAVKRKALQRGFKRDVRLPDNFVATTDRLLERSTLDALSIVGKAGLAVLGFAKVEAAVSRHQVPVLIHAEDGSADGVRKIEATARAQWGAELAKRIMVIRAFNSAQLDLALGRSNVIHAALLAGAATDTFIARFSRLERFRTGNPDGTGMKPEKA
jgi:predicted RNA-binding protein YlxR (DUF448 family)